MSSIQVPELYKENILKGEQKESGRKQLSMSRILRLSVNGDENHAQLGRVDIQTGRCVSPQEREEIPPKNSFCKAFSIRYESMYYSVSLIHFSVHSFSPFELEFVCMG